MRKCWYKAVLVITVLCGLTACDKDDDATSLNNPESTEETSSSGSESTEISTLGAYIINTGNWDANNGTIQWYDKTTEYISTDLYAAANGKGIGDVQDLCVYGSRVYIACSTSAKIEIVSRKGFAVEKTLNLATDAGEAIQPRYLTALDGFVYFTAYDGTVSKLDTLSLSVTSKIEVGAYPEALAAANGKLYVNISGYGSGKTVAVVDVATFTKTKDIEVVLNPYDVCFTADDGKVYFISCGDNGKTISGTLQCIDPDTDAVTTVCNATKADVKDGKVYYIHADYYSSAPGVIGVYDMSTKTSTEFVAYSNFNSAQFIAVDPVSGDVYIGDYSYTSLNDVYIYGSDGTLKKKLETGYYTTNVRFVTE